MRWDRWFAAGFAALLVGAVNGSVGVSAASGQMTVLETVSAPPITLASENVAIRHFAQEGGMLAWWIDGVSETDSVIKVRSARGGSPVVIDRPDGGDGAYGAEVFALSGSRVVWAGFVGCCNHGYGTVETAARGSKPRQLRSIGQEYWAWGDYLTGAAGEGATLVYSIVKVVPFYGSNDKIKSWGVAGGGIWRVVGTRDFRVPAVPPTKLLAATRGTIALVPADTRRVPTEESTRSAPIAVRAAPNARVEIRDAVSGAIRTSFRPGGDVTALGMDAETVVVIVRSGQAARIEWHSTKSGMLIGAQGIARDVADVVDVSGHFLVFRRARVILALDIATGRTREVARARSVPEGLSIEGTRVAWAETTGADKDGYGGRGAIRAVTVR